MSALTSIESVISSKEEGVPAAVANLGKDAKDDANDDVDDDDDNDDDDDDLVPVEDDDETSILVP